MPLDEALVICVNPAIPHIYRYIPVPRGNSLCYPFFDGFVTKYTTKSDSPGPLSPELHRAVFSRHFAAICSKPFSILCRLISEIKTMKQSVCFFVLAILFFASACSRPTPAVTHAASPAPADTPRVAREVRVAGIVEAVHSTKVLVPQLYGQYSQMTLT